MSEPVNLWLDDVRNPLHFGAVGFLWVKTVDEAKRVLQTGTVKRASLDHDLGACDDCMAVWRENPPVDTMPNCEHFGTGYALVLWMAENNIWPKEKPTVHSMNPAGRERMRGVIDRYWSRPCTPPDPTVP